MTSSSRSAGSVRSGRQVGGVTTRSARTRRPSQPTCSRRRDDRRRRRSAARPYGPGRAGSSWIATGALRVAHLDRSRRSVAPPSSMSSCDGTGRRDRTAARGRRRARSAWPPRWTACAGGTSGRPRPASKCAASMTSSVDAVVDLGRQAAHGAGQPDRPASSVMTQVLGVEVAHDVVEGLQPLARRAPGGRRSGR